jgi:hypothetical protein
VRYIWKMSDDSKHLSDGGGGTAHPVVRLKMAFDVGRGDCDAALVADDDAILWQMGEDLL